MSKRKILLCYLIAAASLVFPLFAENKVIFLQQYYHLDENFWSFKLDTTQGPLEIRLLTPKFKSRSMDYALALHIARAMKQEKNFQPVDSFKVDLSNDQDLQPELQKSWELTDRTKEWYNELDGFLDKGPVPKGVIIAEVNSASSIWKGLSKIKGWFRTSKDTIPHSNTLSAPWNEKEWQVHLLEKGIYQDAFTYLSTQALQTDETPFVAEKECRGSYQFVLHNQELRLEPIHRTTDRDIPRMIAAIEAYRTYLKRTFAWRILDGVDSLFEQELDHYSSIFSDNQNHEEQLFGYLKGSIGIDFDEMIKNHQPLLPDHVFKCNVSVNNIEMPQVESLFLRLSRILKTADFKDDILLGSSDQFLRFLETLNISSSFSLREIRGIYCSFKKFSQLSPMTSRSFKNYLDSFVFTPDYEQAGFGEKIRDLTPQAFHRLMEIVFVDTGLLDKDLENPLLPERFFTGRKIVHLGICGYKTMGDKDQYDPCRNLFELLHLYHPLVEGNEATLHELLAFVISKKSLWSHYPPRSSERSEPHERRVARLLPFPDKNGEKLWYYVDGLLNDGNGDLNYVLVPACKGYVERVGEHPTISKRSPLIKLYRSTASDPEAESSLDSLLANTNPEKIGSLDFEAGDEYEMTYFGRCTMPLWAGYLIAGDMNRATQSFKTLYPFKEKASPSLIPYEDKIYILLQFMVWQKFQIQPQDPTLLKKEMEQILNQFAHLVGGAEFKYYLSRSIQGMEWEKQKIAQDILFVGHSLGGVLAQSGLYHFGPEQNRIPLYGCVYRCIAYDTPGVTHHEANQFLKFGRDHKNLLLTFKQYWEIQYQLEYGDLVPQVGQCFLGVQGYRPNLDESWLKITATLCKPRSSTQDLILTTMPTHGRRFNHAQLSTDYERLSVSVAELDELKSNWVLSSALREKFGYEWSIPRLTETFRRTIPGNFAFAYFWTKKQARSLFSSNNLDTDKDRVVFCTYKGKGIPRGYVNEPSYPRDLIGLLQADSQIEENVK
jgi:hypothetical protein